MTPKANSTANNVAGISEARRMWNPDLHALEHGLEVVEAPIPETGRYYHHERLIVLRAGMSQLTRRCAFAHELGHAHYNDTTTTPRIEARADRWAAGRLIHAADVARCARDYPDHPELWCDELEVTPHMLRTWISNPNNYRRAERLRRAVA